MTENTKKGAKPTEAMAEIDPRMPQAPPAAALKKPLKPTGGNPGDWAYDGLLTGWTYRATKREMPGRREVFWKVTATSHDGPRVMWVRTWREVSALLLASEFTRGQGFMDAIRKSCEEDAERFMVPIADTPDE